MSISSEITRISNAKTAIAQSIANKGVTVPSGTKIDGMAALIDSIQTGGGGGDTSETWVLNENVDTSTKQTFVCSFESNGRTFSKLVISGRAVPGPDGFVYSLSFDDIKVAEGGLFFAESLYRKVTFAAAPTGGLLTWLEANGVKQASDTAVQPSKALTVASNGTTTITPDAPYDAIKQVNLTVNVASGGGGGTIDYNTIATTWAKYDCDFYDGVDKTISVTGNTTGLGAVLSPNGESFAVFTFGVPPAGTATSLCLNGYVWCFALDNGEALVLKTAENVSFMFIADTYIYIQPA